MSYETQWVDKHAPESLKNVQGHNKDIKQIRKWAKNWSHGDDPQMLMGPPGIGKTTIARALSNDFDWPIVEINASDSRKDQELKEIAQEIDTKPTLSEWKLVMVDEVDNLHHTTDKQPLYDALKDPGNPVILLGNNKYDTPYALKDKCKVRDMSLGKRSRKSYIKKVAKEEDIDCADEDIERLAERPGLRSAIHDLQMWDSYDDGRPMSKDVRGWEDDEFTTVEKMIRGQADSGGATPPDMLIWLDENIGKHYRGLEATLAYNTLSRADEWVGRANTTQNYKWWKYAGDLLDHIPLLKVTDTWDGYLNLDFPEWFRHSTNNPNDSSAESQLYRTLKNFETGEYGFSGSYEEFRQVTLPMLQSLPKKDRLQLCLEHGLEQKERGVLDITKAEYNGWVEGEVPEERQESSEELMHSDPLDF